MLFNSSSREGCWKRTTWCTQCWRRGCWRRRADLGRPSTCSGWGRARQRGSCSSLWWRTSTPRSWGTHWPWSCWPQTLGPFECGRQEWWWPCSCWSELSEPRRLRPGVQLTSGWCRRRTEEDSSQHGDTASSSGSVTFGQQSFSRKSLGRNWPKPM